MKKTYLQKGFTLIELLVVIAIIGLLSAVVLASLNTARSKSADAAAKTALAGAHSQAELFYDSNLNSYSGSAAAQDVCESTGLVSGVRGVYQQVLSAAKAVGGNTATVAIDGAGGVISATATNAACHSVAAGWAAEVMLKNGTDFYCVDSTGSSKQQVGTFFANAVDVSCN